MSERLILLLEDDVDRVTRMRRALGSDIKIHVWASARRMINECAPLLLRASLISLDHDLVPIDGNDPGDGLEIAKHLVTTSRIVPVIVHTSNGERGRWMTGEFELGGWPCRRVLPVGEDWIESEWLSEVKAAMRDAS